MSVIRPFQATDLLRINNVNIDAWTETVSHPITLMCGKKTQSSSVFEQYRASFYLEYCATWPDFSCVVTDAKEDRITAYGKKTFPR